MVGNPDPRSEGRLLYGAPRQHTLVKLWLCPQVCWTRVGIHKEQNPSFGLLGTLNSGGTNNILCHETPEGRTCSYWEAGAWFDEQWRDILHTSTPLPQWCWSSKDMPWQANSVLQTFYLPSLSPKSLWWAQAMPQSWPTVFICWCINALQDEKNLATLKQ